MKIFISRLGRALFAVPITVCLIIISPVLRIRFIRLFVSRIGHYSNNTEIILCALDSYASDDKFFKTFFYASPREKICNTQLHRMWKRVIPILSFPAIVSMIDNLLLRFGGEAYRSDPIKKLEVSFEDRYNLLEKIKTCHLSFTTQEEQEGEALLKQLGVPCGAPFVCLLVRDAGYLNRYMPEVDWSYHACRDSNINTYELAARHLAGMGYYVIRMGKFVTQPFLTNHARVIDYANSALRSDFMDIYLSAKCFFFLSTSCGVDSVARIFRKPLLVTNLVLADFDIWNPGVLFFIPKKIMHVQENRFLTYQEMKKLFFEMKSKKKVPEIMVSKGLCYVDNTPEELKAVTQEMVAWLTREWHSSEEDKALQQRFWQVFPRYLPDNLPNWPFPISNKIQMKVGSDFLRNNLSLFQIDTLQVNST